MIDIIEAFSENIVETIVIILLCAVALIFYLLAIVSFPIKRVRLWFAGQMIRISRTMDYYLNESIYDD